MNNILKEWQNDIESSITPYIKIMATRSNDLSLWQSKFYGFPYLPTNQNYPVTSKGAYLYLLAQINFEEMPKVQPYPEKGLLQFWISVDDEMFGLDLSKPTYQDLFKIIYYPDIQKENLTRDFSFLPQLEDTPFPFLDTETEYAIKFSKKEMPVCLSDYRCDRVFKNADEDFFEAYENIYYEGGHRIGGYAHFTQEDPRYQTAYKDKEYLLLQIDTDDENQIMWGDGGVANFFISEKDLKKRDFSNVLYNWDCY